MTKIFLAGIALTITVCSCNKKEQGHDYRLPQGLKDYFDYRKGSYWVFIDSLTGSIDSFEVYSYADTVMHHTEKGVTSSGETMFIRIPEYYNIPTEDHRNWDISIETPGNGCAFIPAYPYHNAYDLTVGGYPFTLGNTASDIQREILSSVSVNGKVYSNVYRYRMTFAGGNYDEILTSPDSGFVKISFNNQDTHQILELQHAHIVR